MATLAWCSFASREATHWHVEAGHPVIDIAVEGGCSPNPIRVQVGAPVRLRFNQQENCDQYSWACGRAARRLGPDLRVSRWSTHWPTTGSHSPARTGADS
ncbi:hypothetical protein [Modestobacter sp. VKM Ac-2984]|uniref:hypothetical protein n=1 Tax=Modestobacter sp. VKM Ac-2984 TaxID=3004138 RepID=UPI0022AA2A14|nr:hypothetical protein [Modestobacter sp. VKM Ac-2984]MCZ2818004.1 hypothetical protein [Modestobacter sp. VKM Ac-2984]